MEARSVADILVAVVASGLLTYGLLTGLDSLRWETALGIGLLLTALLGFGLPVLLSSLPLKVLLAAAGVAFLLLPAFAA